MTDPNSDKLIFDAFNNEFMLDDLHIDISLDHIFPPSHGSLNSSHSGLEPGQIDPNGFSQPLIGVFKSSPELRHISGESLVLSASDNVVVEQKIHVDEMILKDSSNVTEYDKCNFVGESSNGVFMSSEEDRKRKVRLFRNRESAQLSRQRKKHYVEELEDKVRTMHSTIHDLNAKISYVISENAGLRSRIGGGESGRLPPQQMPLPPPPGPGPGIMYPHPPWMPPYMVKPQGSHVPLVPIPRLKPMKCSKKVENANKTPMKIKKVASVSFLGVLFFVLLFGGLVPTLNMRYGGVKEPLIGGDFSESHHGKVLVVDGQVNYSGKHDYGTHCGRRGDSHPNCNEELVDSPLTASLYVPRNDKLVKLDGNLIIHSVLASETSHTSGETDGLAVAGDLATAIPGRQFQYQIPADLKRAIGSGAKEKAKSTKHQWFLEGVAGPMLSSGMCTEVFQFDVSSAIVPSNTLRNISGVSHNMSEEHTGKKDGLTGNSSMVVSVLVDPREAGDADVDGSMMGPKSISRIFIVVLIDSVKYVTYSCMLPFKGSDPLVTT